MQTDIDMLLQYGPPSAWPEDAERDPELRARLQAAWDSLSMRERKDVMKFYGRAQKTRPAEPEESDDDAIVWADKMLAGE